MGLFSVTPRKKSSTAEQAADARPPVKSRLSIRSVLSRKESCERVARRQAAAPKGSKASAGLTVSVEATRQDSRHPIVYTAPCRYVATSTKLGSGAYGAVLLGRDMCFGNAPVAIKFIPDGRMRTSSLDREVAMLQRLSDAKHPSLVKFYGHVHPENVKAGEVRAEVAKERRRLGLGGGTGTQQGTVGQDHVEAEHGIRGGAELAGAPEDGIL